MDQKHIVQLDVVHVDDVLANAEANLSAPANLSAAMAELRVLSAADGCPDEGMRGFVDTAREMMLGDHLCPRILGAAAGALKTDSPEAAAHAAALVRNLSITPTAAQRIADSPVPAALALRLKNGGPITTLALSLAAVMRLAQHHETHADMRAVGFPAALPKECTSSEERFGAARWFTEMTCLVRAFFLDTRQSGSKHEEDDPMFCHGMVDRLVGMLSARLDCNSAAEVVEKLGLYYRPRFIVQGLANLARIPALRRHLGSTSSSALTLLLRVLAEPCGEDRAQNEPWGSPSARQMALYALLALAEDHDVATRIVEANGEHIIKQAAVEDPQLQADASAVLVALGLELVSWPTSSAKSRL